MSNFETAYPEFGGRSVVFDGQEFALAELYGRFAEHDHGVFQAAQVPRFYKVFGYGEHQDFVSELGDDTHPVRHMLHTTANIAIPFVDAQKQEQRYPQFEGDEEAGLLITSTIHDADECEHPAVAESLGFHVGDVPVHEVTSTHELQKRDIRTKFIYPTHYPDFSPPLVDAVEGVMTNGEKTFSSHAFQKVEHLGYFKTALHAATIVETECIQDNFSHPRALALAHLAVRVSFHWQQSLEGARHVFPYIDDQLVQAKPALQFVKQELRDIDFYAHLRSR